MFHEKPLLGVVSFGLTLLLTMMAVTQLFTLEELTSLVAGYLGVTDMMARGVVMIAIFLAIMALPSVLRMLEGGWLQSVTKIAGRLVWGVWILLGLVAGLADVSSGVLGAFSFTSLSGWLTVVITAIGWAAYEYVRRAET